MKFVAKLSKFNRLLADACLPLFPAGVEALQSNNSVLCFRGPVQYSPYETRIVTQVSISLDRAVKDVLHRASSTEWEETTAILIENMKGRIQNEYDSQKVGDISLDFVGSMDIVRSQSKRNPDSYWQVQDHSSLDKIDTLIIPPSSIAERALEGHQGGSKGLARGLEESQ